jgi:hypothetical protein
MTARAYLRPHRLVWDRTGLFTAESRDFARNKPTRSQSQPTFPQSLGTSGKMSPLAHPVGPLSRDVARIWQKRTHAVVMSAHFLTESRDFAANEPARSSSRLICREVPRLCEKRARCLIQPARFVAQWRDSGKNEPAGSSSQLTSSQCLGTLKKIRRLAHRFDSLRHKVSRLSHRVAGLRWKQGDSAIKKLARSCRPPTALPGPGTYRLSNSRRSRANSSSSLRALTSD